MRTAAFALLLAAPLAACAAHRLEVAGTGTELRAADSAAGSDVERAMIVAEAARDFTCQPANVGVRASAGDPDVHVADGCGLRAVYLSLHADGVAYDAPDRPSRPTDVRAIPIVRIAGDAHVASLRASSFYARIRLRQQDFERAQAGLRLIDRYFALQAAGARDMGCIQEQVVPMLEGAPGAADDAPRTPVAEGCGKRATYSAAADGSFKLVSVNSVAIGAAAVR